MALIRVYVAALIGLVLLFEVNFVDSALFCNKCTSAKNGESCGNEVKDAAHCTDNGDYNHCMTYQYTFNDSKVTVRDCPDASYNCKTLFADGKNTSLLMCNECNDDFYCNAHIDTSSNTCAKCNSLDSQDCGETIEDVGGNTCFLDDTVNTNCLLYKYKGDSSMVTVRDCGRTNTCDSLRSGEYKDNLYMCDECSNTNGNNCNQNISVSKTCVKCNSLEQPGCESATIDTSIIKDTCYLDDTVNTECITYKYKNASKIVTVRDCASKDTCKDFLSDTYKEALVMCHECSLDTPNCNQNLDDLPTCVECNSSQNANCSESKIDITPTTGVCYLDSIINFECITYQYQEKDSSIVSVRGCAPAKNCEVLHSDTYKDALLMCDECSDNSNCNQEFDTTKTCIECNSKDDPDCQESTSLTTTCYLDQTVKTKCITYKINNENNQTVTVKGCAPDNQCSNLLSSENSSLLMCDACTNIDGKNNCNKKIDVTKTCIECNSENNPDCANFHINPSITNATCYLDQTVNSECVMYKDKETSVVVRGCVPTNSCATLSSKNELSYCFPCSSANCNANIHTSGTCVKCNSSTDSNCGDSIAEVTTTCLLDETVNTECVSYKYQNDDHTQVTIRDCAPKDYCETLHNGSLIMCNHCTGNNCNKKIEHSKRCIVCNSIDDPNCIEGRIDTTIVLGRCYLDDTVNVQCVSYKYYQDGQTYIYRGCGSENYCDHAWSNTTTCTSCTSTDSVSVNNMCNLEPAFDKEKTLCIKCTSENDEECGKDDMNSNKVKEYCPLDDDNSECVAYKYLNLLNGKIQTNRGCAPENHCTVLNAYSNTTVCNEGKSLISNKKIDTSNEATLCVECTDEEGTSCAAEKVAFTQVGLCKISNTDEKGCFAYKYLNSSTGKMITERGCESQGYCDLHNTNYTALCNECQGEICNSKINATTERAFCVECDGEEGTECGNDEISDLSQVRFCGLTSSDLKCVAYRYLNVTSGKINTHRGCESEDYCNQNASSTTITCTKCKEIDQYCNQNIDKNNQRTLCVKCDSEADDSECSKDSVDLSKVDFCGIATEEELQCVAYKYLNVTTNTLSTHRGCETKDYCAQYNTSTTILCDECKNDNNCNMAIDPTDVTLCVQCNSEDGSECSKDTSDLTQAEFCKIDSPNDKCIAYRYLNVTSGNVNTYRGCEVENYCSQQNDSTKIICSECDNDNNCNMKIETDQEITLCVSCDGEACASNSVDLKQIGFCGLASSDTQCVTYRYLDVKSGNINTYRGCESENYCAQYNNSETTLLCNECTTGNLCNRIIENEDALCVECSGDQGSECAADMITDFNQVDFCKINSSNKRQCVAYRYLDVTSGKIRTHRGCELDNYCDNQSTDSQMAMICSICKSADTLCNKEIDTSNEQTLCIDCIGGEGTDCANDTINDLTKVHFCKLTDNQQCVTHKYLDDQTNNIRIKRGCENTNYCNKYKNGKNTLVCDECHDEICNVNTKNEGKFICVQCNSEQESECAHNTVSLAEVNACIINSKDNQQCVSHKYLNVSTGKINTYRGCEFKDYCEQHNSTDNGSTALCMQCNNNDHCNMNIDTSKQLTLCIECIGEEGSDCAAPKVDLTKMSFCGISHKNKKECISYRYLEESTSRLKTVRGCETRNCSTLVVDDGEVQQCSECHEDICNNYL
ncbi:unnamed protein product [Ceutorhynchus assimilis]|uniref:Uncharacterized protein n=1 Tax=Ceutorhynchus assimilis TaxID=467358 RepID=A0A9N9Q9R8_9CUCU|nr:unnamed protein product [Ceutorhynchus assimilis]